MNPKSPASRVREQLARVVDGLASLMREVPIRHFDRFGGSAVFITPEYFWTERSSAQHAAQLRIKRDYEPVAELLRILLKQAPKDLLARLKEADQRFRMWLEFESNWSLSPDPNDNEREFRSDANALFRLLDVLDATPADTPWVVADTNSLLNNPDPSAYRSIAGSDSFTFILLPTVLAELDKLKVEHRNPEVREKAKRVISRIKGWRNQGV